MAVALQPTRHALAPDDLGALMTAVAQGHDEDPALAQLLATLIEQPRAGAEVHLRGLRGRTPK